MDKDYLFLLAEISVTVYAFLLGLPILVSQILMPDDLRRMSKKNYTGNFWLPILFLSLCLVAIIGLTILGSRVKVAPGELTNAENFLSFYGFLATALFFFMMILTLWFLYNHLMRSQGYRAKIVDVIKKKILENYGQSGNIDKAFLKDLEHLGIYSKAGAETANAIEALEELLIRINENKEIAFDNDNLIAIIETLCVCVTNSVEPGSKKNMVDVLTIYKSILMDLKKYSSRENILNYGNETRILKDNTTTIAVTSLKRDYSDMMPLILNVLTLIPRSSDKLFDIGLLALEKNEFQIATNVLSEIMDRDNQDYLTMNNYLGLVAHFFFAGNTARKWAKRSLENNRIKISKKVLKDAMEYHYIISNFITVDKLEQLLLSSRTK